MNILVRLALAICLVCSLPAPAVPAPPPPAPPGTATELVLADGARLLASGVPYPSPGQGYAFGIWKYRPDRTLDTRFNGRGFIAVPIWGYYEGAAALAVQPDGRIVVLGYATDPTDPSLREQNCHPALCGVYAALVRLHSDGTLDFSFNRGGKVVIDYPSEDARLAMQLQEDGSIEVSDAYVSGPLARVSATGSVESLFKGDYVVQAYPFFHAQGLWTTAGNQRGPQLALSQQGDTIFVTSIEADAATGLTWQVGAATRSARSTWIGYMVRTSGTPLPDWPFKPVPLQVISTGDIRLRFQDSDHVTVDRTSLDGTVTTQAFVRVQGPAFGCAFGAFDELASSENVTDVWFDAGQPGWGLHLLQVDTASIFATWLTYDVAGRPIALQGGLDDLYGDYKGELSSGSTKATVLLEVRDGNELNFNYMPNSAGWSGSVRISRMVYRSPGSACR